MEETAVYLVIKSEKLKACKVEMAQSREEIEAMPNGSGMLSIYTDNDIETYRDVLYYVGQVLAQLINRIGYSYTAALWFP